MSGIKVRLFGKFTVEQNGNHVQGMEAHKVQELFCYLLIHYNRPQSREALSELLWVDQPSAKSKKNLRQTLWRLQSALDVLQSKCQALLTDEDWVQINAEAGCWVDSVDLEKAYNHFNHRRARELNPDDFTQLENSVALYRGELLEGWYQDWCIFERERFQSMYTTLMDKLIQYCEINRLFDAGIAYGAEILRRDRAYERTHRQMMRLYYMAGDRTQALRQYARCVAALEEELGVTPSERTTSLYEQIRTDRFIPPTFDGNRQPVAEANGDAPLSAVLARLQNFAATLDSIQLRVQREIVELEQSLEINK